MKGVIFFHNSIEEEIKSLQRRGQKFKKRYKNKNLDMFLFSTWIKLTVSPDGHLGIKKCFTFTAGQKCSEVICRGDSLTDLPRCGNLWPRVWNLFIDEFVSNESGKKFIKIDGLTVRTRLKLLPISRGGQNNKTPYISIKFSRLWEFSDILSYSRVPKHMWQVSLFQFYREGTEP